MKKVIKVCLIAALVFALIGLGINIIGGFNMNRNTIYSDDISLQDGYKFDGKEIENIDLNIKAGELIIKESDLDNISVEVFEGQDNRRDIEVKQESDTLKIDEYYSYSQSNIFRDNVVKVIIYLPKDIQLENANLDVDAGKIEVEKLTVNDMLKIEAKAGSVKLNNIEASYINATCHAGKIDMDVNTLDKMNLECHAGSISGDINESVSKFNYDIDSSAGVVKINGRKYEGYYGNENRDNIIEAECNAGSIQLYLEK